MNDRDAVEQRFEIDYWAMAQAEKARTETSA